MVVAADEELPTVKILEFPDVLRDGAGGDVQLGGRQDKAAEPGAGFESLERIEGRDFARHRGPKGAVNLAFLPLEAVNCNLRLTFLYDVETGDIHWRNARLVRKTAHARPLRSG